MKKNCPSCGRHESADLQFVRAFCVDCFTKRETLYEVPKKLELKRCSRCGKSFVSGKWRDFPDAELGKWAASKINSRMQVDVKEVTLREVKGGILATADIGIDVDGTAIEKRVGVMVGVQKALCSDCHKKSGGYREAIIQIRGGTPARKASLAKKLIAELEKGSFISDYEVNKDGIDFSVGSRSHALRAVGALSRRFTQSNTLIGQREGKRMYRATICVRLD